MDAETLENSTTTEKAMREVNLHSLVLIFCLLIFRYQTKGGKNTAPSKELQQIYILVNMLGCSDACIESNSVACGHLRLSLKINQNSASHQKSNSM